MRNARGATATPVMTRVAVRPHQPWFLQERPEPQIQLS